MSALLACKLGDVIKFGNGKSRPQTEGNIPVYGGNGILGYCDELNYDRETIVIGRVGAYCGATYYAKQPIWISDNALSAKPKDNNNTKYFYYFLKHMDLNQHAGGSSHPLVTQTLLNSLDVEITANPEEQKAIASVLSSLDDKVDLLHRQNTTLERMAEVLFRQWFVEEAQDDWEVGNLGSIADNIRKPVKAKDIQATIKYIGLEHIDRRNVALEQYGLGADVSSNKYVFEKNDILFGKLRPYFHKVCFSPFSGVCSTDILVIRPKSYEYFAFCLFAFFQDDVVDYANLGSGGTRMPRTDWAALKQYPISIPDKSTLQRFNGIVLLSINKITENLAQIQTLEKLRDTLLPKLMSGEVRIS